MSHILEKCYNFKEAEKYIELGLYPYFMPIQKVKGNSAIVNGKYLIMVGSNNYLGLAQEPSVVDSAISALNEYGSSTCGSRFLNGTLNLHTDLELKLAEFMGYDSAIAFSTGFQTNLGIIPSIVCENDIVIIDQYAHASIIDACMLSKGKIMRFRHNSPSHLEKVILNAKKQSNNILVAVDGVYSMEGDIAVLNEIYPITKKHNCCLFVDDAHGIGVLGEHGRGTVEHFDLINKVDIIMGTFSKSFASLGGFVVSNNKIIDYIKHMARPFIFSASISPANVGAALGSLKIIKEQPWRRQKLIQISHSMLEKFKNMGFDVGTSQTPIIPVIIGEIDKTFMMWKRLIEYGVFTNPILSPAVPPNKCLIRTSFTATINEDELKIVEDAFYKAGKELNIIP